MRSRIELLRTSEKTLRSKRLTKVEVELTNERLLAERLPHAEGGGS